MTSCLLQVLALFCAFIHFNFPYPLCCCCGISW